MDESKQHIFPIENSDLYQFWKMERDEINKVKWVESERLGYDCGMWRAEWVWWMQHRRSWISGIRESGYNI